MGAMFTLDEDRAVLAGAGLRTRCPEATIGLALAVLATPTAYTVFAYPRRRL